MYKYREEHRIALMARIFNVSESGYYKWVARNQRGGGKKEKDDLALKKLIKRHYHASGQSFGSRKIVVLLNDGSEQRINHKRVERLMREENLFSKVFKTHIITTDSSHGYPVSPNLLKRDFMVTGPNQKLVSDTTYIATMEGTLYVAVILDLHGRLPVGTAMSKRNDKQLVLSALDDMLMRGHGAPGCILHSDRGSTYASHEYQDALKQQRFQSSMSRKGDCWDNAPMESFWGKMKTEYLKKRYTTIEEAKKAVYEYVWYFYSHFRPHTALGYETPARYYQRHI